MTPIRPAKLGVCYYPEHWPEENWAADAREMYALGIRLVRIGEFAWSRIEPQRNDFRWRWLDRALDVLAAAELEVIMGTPTACPPKWLLDEYPEIYPVDAEGRRRGFGSRRHYCFSSSKYRKECSRIVAKLLERYATHSAIVGWQTDNEFGCHDTTLSYSPSALRAFRAWLREKYGSIERLNAAWGTVFWSQEYGDFDAVELPMLAVTELNPAHRLDFQRFSSAQIRRFNAQQVESIRAATGDRSWVTHNFMGESLDFDHFDVAADLDVASWDSYPLGFLEQSWLPDDVKRRYRQTGHPDWAAFHHDLYRGVGRGRFAVMEQQPGAVNWAPNNAAPRDGMIRLWSWEALAHGAEFVSYFRWRQAPFAQEQMHSGLKRVDGSATPAAEEVHRVASELERLALPPRAPAQVALMFDYESLWMSAIQPQARGFRPLALVFAWYGALRRLGVDTDIVAPSTSLADYRLVLVPHVLRSAALDEQVVNAPGHVVLGPCAASKSDNFCIPQALPPAALKQRIPLKVTAVDALREDVELPLMANDSGAYAVARWLETVATDLEPRFTTADGRGVCYANDSTTYVNAWLNDSLLDEILSATCHGAGVTTHALPADVRRAQRGDLVVFTNYGTAAQRVAVDDAELVLGAEVIEAADVSAWRIRDAR